MSKDIKKEAKDHIKDITNLQKEFNNRLNKIDEEKQKFQKLSEEYLNDLKHLKAEFENYQKRIEQEKQEFQKYASIPVIQKLLYILDNFELALKDKEDNEFTQGILLIQKQIQKILEEENVKEIKAINEDFDPFKHEAIDCIDGEENKILEEVQKGYTIHNKVIRPSKVKVGKGVKNEK